ncbi:kinase [Rhizobium sp. Leaf262]|uniref:GHMP family kinase ATP-binding protein n=1 Tax=Rhizobium sp. Leaf262 TaxID=1736312 RepID=UPI000715C128|nr:kinase [Rhizobium sp. Leaf262]KQO79770.1 kinase [Rhizobium sp. Leaf262]
MIITKTPFRISFFGGGTDYPDWYREHGGSVLATSIDKYCYITCRRLPPFFDHKHRIVYSKIENVKSINEIVHPAVRNVMQWMNVTEGLEIHHDGDLPARSGLGSSSSFTVGLIHAINALRGQYTSKKQLALDAIHIEQEVIKEHVGSQDQASAALGGFNRIDFLPSGDLVHSPVIVEKERQDALEDHMMLFFTGMTRIASEIAKAQIDNMTNRYSQLKHMHAMVDEGLSILGSRNASLDGFGRLLDDAWKYKRSLSASVSNSAIDDLYAAGIGAGALGGKILGAGGGGFLLVFARPEDQPRVRDALHNLIHVPFRFENGGSSVVLYQPNGF